MTTPDVPDTVSPQAQEFLRANTAVELPGELTAELAELVRALSRDRVRPVLDGLREEHRLAVSASEAGGVPVVVVDPPERAPGLVLYVHGGAYAFGEAEDGTALQLAARLRRRVVSVAYRLAPEHVYPAAVDDCLAAYRATLETAGGPVVLAGTSAGAGLVLAVLQRVQARGLPLPDAVLALTPWAELDHAADSYLANEGRDPLIRWSGQLEAAAAAYAGGTDPRDPGLSALHATWTAPLPPTLITTGTRDLFLSDCVRLYWALREAGTPAELRLWEGMWHAFFGVPELPETARFLEEVAAFCDQHAWGTGSARQGALVDAHGVTVLTRSWPVDAARGLVLLSHGASEHSGRYDRFARALNGAGFSVAALDHRGHGGTGPSSGVGVMGPGGGAAVVEDLHALRAQASTGVPVFLFGHSMGSLVALAYLAEHADGLSGAVLCGFPSDVGAVTDTAALLQGIADGGQRDQAFTGLADNNTAVEQPRTPYDWLSRDAEEVDRYVADPLCGDGNPLTYGYLADLFEVVAPAASRLGEIGCPLLVVAGDQDPAAALGAHPTTLAQALREAGRDVDLTLYEGARHELLNETNRDEVTADVVAWLERHLPRG